MASWRPGRPRSAPRGATLPASRERRRGSSALDRRLARPMVAGDQQNDPVARAIGLLQAAVDRRPRQVEVEAVEVEDAIGLDGAGAQLAIPAAVERLAGRRRWRAPSSSGGRTA